MNPQTASNPVDKLEVDSSAPYELTPPPQNNTPFILLAVGAAILLLVGAAVFFTYRNWDRLQTTEPTNYEECAKAPGSRIQESYPATCITGDGFRFVQPTETSPISPPPAGGSPTPQYSCPSNGWVDCMPTIGEQKNDCSPEAMNWYKANCPNFQGGAY